MLALVPPEAARKQTDAGAVAFVQFSWGLYEQMNLDPIPGLLTSYGTADCTSCKGFADWFKEAKEKGIQSVGGSGFVASCPTVDPESTATERVVRFNQIFPGSTELVRGRIVTEFPSDLMCYAVRLNG